MHSFKNKSLSFHHSFKVGTPIYMSPEIKAEKSYNNKTDMYSLGIIFFELIMPKFETEMERIKEI